MLSVTESKLYEPTRRRQNSRGKPPSTKILSEAARLFWQKGYLGTSVDEIAKAANVNKAIIYYYFENKVDLLYQVMLSSMRELLALATPIVNSNMTPKEKFEKLILNHMEWRTSHIGLAGIAEVERKNLPPKDLQEYINMRDEYEMGFRRTLKEVIDSGGFRDLDPKLASFFTLGLLNSITRWYRPNGPLSPSDIASEACRFIFQGLEGNR